MNIRTLIDLTKKEWNSLVQALEKSGEDSSLLEKIKKKLKMNEEQITKIEVHKEEKIGEATALDWVCFLNDNEKGFGFLKSNQSIEEVLREGFPENARICVFCRSETDSLLIIEGLKELAKELEKNRDN